MILEQVVSRLDPAFDVAGSQLGIGRDGLVYLTSGGRVLRVAKDGSGARLGQVGYAANSVTADATGLIATAEAHFPHRVAFWNKDFTPLGQVDSFTDNDTVGWAAPSAVENAPSRDFYALDQYEKRVLRLNRLGAVQSYALNGITASAHNWTGGLRVSEARSRIYSAWQSGRIWVNAFDDSLLWNIPVRPAGHLLSAFDVADDGQLYVLSSGAQVKLYNDNGVNTGSITLALRDTKYPVNTLRLQGNEIYVRRDDPATLFEVYNRATGAFVRRVAADVERLTVTVPDGFWTAGQAVPLTIAHDRGRWKDAPRFRAWLRPLGVPEFTELPLAGGKITLPADARGLYQLRVSPDVRGRWAEYVVDGVVEIRTPAATGTVSILTTLNRFSFGRGESMPVTVIARGTAPAAVRIKAVSGGKQVPTAEVTLQNGKGQATFDSASWTPGRYVLDADVPGATVAPQHLDLGTGLAKRPDYHITQHGDYVDGFPNDPRTGSGLPPRIADVPDELADHVARAKTLGLTLFADRLGISPDGRFQPHQADAALVTRLTGDKAAIAQEKAIFEDPSRRAIAAYGAQGIEEQVILLYMDAGLPLGTPWDTRTPEKMEADIKSVVTTLRDYPAMRGWSWAANWWLNKHGTDMAIDAAEKSAYTAALAKANETGAWDPVLDKVAARTFALKVDAEARFRAASDSVKPGLISAMTGPYRAIQSPPQVLFANADEVDVQFQAEQIQPPQVTGHEIDFSRRPGKPV